MTIVTKNQALQVAFDMLDAYCDQSPLDEESTEYEKDIHEAHAIIAEQLRVIDQRRAEADLRLAGAEKRLGLAPGTLAAEVESHACNDGCCSEHSSGWPA